MDAKFEAMVERAARSMAATIYGVGNTDATWREFEIDARAALTASGLPATPPSEG